eukprot:CAMPEP_0170492114 /NCGR_PEP_ID=MMETSP0208-20121228/11703_1 /TAXON_ID=197538 /ORGANISM="Strombidium inclinatum, Strain S3" /LENGTH=103 /DNA_ID=CAMNT_0010767809 /DNA_START=351 /DNA_END=659 /DNA_ORIENTATION=+
MNFDDIDAHFSASYFIDALSLKVYQIQYPAFCSVDLMSIISEKRVVKCGYEGDQEKRISPLHAQDPNLYYSALRFLLPDVWGRHKLVKIEWEDVIGLLTNGIV